MSDQNILKNIKQKLKSLWSIPIFKYAIVIHLLYFVISTILTLVFFRSQNDFLVYYQAGEIALTDYMELYNPDNYTWPFRYFPLSAFYFIPFYLMGFDLGFIIFNFVNLILNIIISVYLYKVIKLIRREDHEDNDDRIIVYICIFLLSLPQLFNYFLGQINLYITFFMIFSLYLFLKTDQIKMQFLASLILGISGIFKLTTIFMVPFLILSHYSYKEKKFKFGFKRTIVRSVGILLPLAINSIIFVLYPKLWQDFTAINITGEANTLINYSFSITKLGTNFLFFIGVPANLLIQYQLYIFIPILFIIGGIAFFILIFRRHPRNTVIYGYTFGILVMLLTYFDSWNHHLLILTPLLTIILFDLPRNSEITRKYIKPSILFFSFFDIIFMGVFLLTQTFFPFNFASTIFLILSFYGIIRNMRELRNNNE
ncbi:MAG: glycosyltransferase family 87 protein [Promethearchaeota archaeon]